MTVFILIAFNDSAVSVSEHFSTISKPRTTIHTLCELLKDMKCLMEQVVQSSYFVIPERKSNCKVITQRSKSFSLHTYKDKRQLSIINTQKSCKEKTLLEVFNKIIVKEKINNNLPSKANFDNAISTALALKFDKILANFSYAISIGTIELFRRFLDVYRQKRKKSFFVKDEGLSESIVTNSSNRLKNPKEGGMYKVDGRKTLCLFSITSHLWHIINYQRLSWYEKGYKKEKQKKFDFKKIFEFEDETQKSKFRQKFGAIRCNFASDRQKSDEIGLSYYSDGNSRANFPTYLGFLP